MKQLSILRRRIYFGILSIVFVLCIPVVILYSLGYRLGDALSLVETGGVYVYSNVGGMQLSVNGKLKETTGTFIKNTYVSDLHPGEYTITMSKTGYQTWQKTVRVYANRVSEIHNLPVPEKFQIRVVPRTIEAATSTKKVTTTTTATSTNSSTTKTAIQSKARSPLNQEYFNAVALFNATSTSPLTIFANLDLSEASSTEFLSRKNLRVLRGLVTWTEDKVFNMEWLGSHDSTPYFLCENNQCGISLKLSLFSPVKYYDFYPGRDDVVIIATDVGIQIMELDGRSARNIYTIKAGQGLSFRNASDSLIYIKDGEGTIYAVSIE